MRKVTKCKFALNYHLKQFWDYWYSRGKGFPAKTIEANKAYVNVYVDYLAALGYKNSTINTKVYAVIKHLDMVAKGIFRAFSVQQRNLKVDYKDVVNKVEQCENKRYQLIMKTLLLTGVRVSELINIKRDEIIEDGKYAILRVLGKRRKERSVFITKTLLQEILKYFKEESTYLFSTKKCNKYHRSTIWRIVSRYFDKSFKYYFFVHAFRHLFATYHIVDKKEDVKAVSRYLGHSSVSITLDMYVHSTLTPQQIFN